MAIAAAAGRCGKEGDASIGGGLAGSWRATQRARWHLRHGQVVFGAAGERHFGGQPGGAAQGGDSSIGLSARTAAAAGPPQGIRLLGDPMCCGPMRTYPLCNWRAAWLTPGACPVRGPGPTQPTPGEQCNQRAWATRDGGRQLWGYGFECGSDSWHAGHTGAAPASQAGQPQDCPQPAGQGSCSGGSGQQCRCGPCL